MVTGKNPGKLGVYDFVKRKANSYEIESIQQNWDDWNPILRILNRAGKRTIIVDIPTVTAEEVNGVFVSGLDMTKRRLAYPPQLESRLKRDGYNLDSPYFHEVLPDDYLYEIYNITKKQMNLISQLIENEIYDFFMFVLFYTDQVQHYFWKYMDDRHPLYNPYSKYKDEILNYYMFIDDFLNNLLSRLSQEVTIIVVSDHGFGPHYKDVDLNKFLQEEGFLKLKEVRNKINKGKINRDSIRGFLDWIKSRYVFRKIFLKNITIRKIFERLVNTVSFEPQLKDIVDWSDTLAYSLTENGIFINLKDREPQGVVDIKEYEKIREEVINKLRNLKDGEKCVIANAWKREDIYSGPYVNNAPDIIVEFIDGYTSRIGNKINKEIFNPPVALQSGMHRREGVFLAYGPDIKKGERVDAKIYDIAPTILHIFGLPIPNDMDGRVLMEIFKPDSEIAKREPVYVDPRYCGKDTEKEKLKSAIRELKLKRKI